LLGFVVSVMILKVMFAVYFGSSCAVWDVLQVVQGPSLSTRHGFTVSVPVFSFADDIEDAP